MVSVPILLSILLSLPTYSELKNFSNSALSRLSRQIHEVVENGQSVSAPDLVTSYDIIPGKKQVVLEAFRAGTPGLEDKTRRWASFGYPRIQLQENGAIFKILDTHASILISTLDDLQRTALLTVARETYPKAKLSLNTIIPIAIRDFSCEITAETENGGNLNLKGTALEVSKNPLNVKFPINHGSSVRNQLEKLNQEIFEGRSNVDFICTMHMVTKNVKSNALKMMISDLQGSKLMDKIFGFSNVTWVSKSQMEKLVGEIRKVWIQENYEIEGDDFEDEFIEHLLEKPDFETMDIETAEGRMSKYGINGYLNLRQALSHIFEVKNEGDRKYIHGRSLGDDFSDSGLISMEATVEYAKEKLNDWKFGNVSLEDQLQEINSKSEAEAGVRFKIAGNHVIPEAINLAKMTRAPMERAFQLTRIRNRLSDTAVSRVYELNTAEDVQRQTPTVMNGQTMITVAPSYQNPSSAITTHQPEMVITLAPAPAGTDITDKTLTAPTTQRPYLRPQITPGPGEAPEACGPQECDQQKSYCLRGKFIACKEVLKLAESFQAQVGQPIRDCCGAFIAKEEQIPGECQHGECVKGEVFCIHGTFLTCDDLGINAESVSHGCCGQVPGHKISKDKANEAQKRK